MTTGPQTRSSTPNNRAIMTSTTGSTLADVLERVLDKGIVIAGDISVSVGSTELLSIRIRLLISSVDKAKEIGINWWESDPYLNAQAALNSSSAKEVSQLQEKIEQLEAELRSLRAAALPGKASSNGAEQAAPHLESTSTPKQPIASPPQQAPIPSVTSFNQTMLEQDQTLTLDALMDEL